MSTAVIGATGRVGSKIVRGVLARGGEVAALVRDPDKARLAFGEPDGLHIRRTRLDDPRDLAEALHGIRTVFIAMGSIGIEGVLQRIAINAAARISSIEQITRLSVLNASERGSGCRLTVKTSCVNTPRVPVADGGLPSSALRSGLRPALSGDSGAEHPLGGGCVGPGARRCRDRHRDMLLQAAMAGRVVWERHRHLVLDAVRAG
jgi:NAD(P)H-binding